MLITIRADGAPALTMSWEAFLANNDEAFSFAELEAIKTRLFVGESVTLGGGAAPLATLTRCAVPGFNPGFAAPAGLA